MSAFVLLLLLTARLQAPSPITQAPQPASKNSARAVLAITGVVLDPSGAAISGAQVSVTNTGNITLQNTTTDNQGTFHFEKLPPGVYSLTVQAAGFQDKKQEINIRKKPTVTMRITF